MKYITTLVAFAALTVASHGQTIIDITGATAFRSGALEAIRAAFNAGGAYAGIASNSHSSGTYQAYRGNFGTNPALQNVIVRTSWNGSVEGVRAVATPDIIVGGQNTSPLYINLANITAITNVVGGNLVTVGNGSLSFSRNTSEMAFSDARVQATPVPTGTITGGPVGVVVFSFIANKTWRDDPRTQQIKSITSQQWRSLCLAGRLPLSFFTGNLSDTEWVYASGRNDGSGTRTTYLIETGYGASKPVKHYTAFDRTNATTIPSIQLVPPGGGFVINSSGTFAVPENRSTVWGNDIDGNGGYSSGSELAGDFRKTTENTTVYIYDDDLDGMPGNITLGDQDVLEPASKLFLITWITANDARNTRGISTNSSIGNAWVLGYDGEILEGLANFGGNSSFPLTPADLAKVTNGRYAGWSNQQLYRVSGNATLAAAFDVIKGNLTQARIGVAGVEFSLMNVERGEDGGIIEAK